MERIIDALGNIFIVVFLIGAMIVLGATAVFLVWLMFTTISGG